MMVHRLSGLYGGRCGPDCTGRRNTETKLRGAGNIKNSSVEAKVKRFKAEILYLTVNNNSSNNSNNNNNVL